MTPIVRLDSMRIAAGLKRTRGDYATIAPDGGSGLGRGVPGSRSGDAATFAFSPGRVTLRHREIIATPALHPAIRRATLAILTQSSPLPRHTRTNEARSHARLPLFDLRIWRQPFIRSHRSSLALLSTSSPLLSPPFGQHNAVVP